MPENATTPLRGFPYSADLDLFGAGRKIIEFCDRARIKTDIAVKLSSETCKRIAPRSE